MKWRRALGLGVVGLCCGAMLMAGPADRLSPTSGGQLQATATASNPQLSAQSDANRATPRAACDNAIWDNGYTVAWNTAYSSQLDLVYPFHSQAADDFMLDFEIDIEDFHWKGFYWNFSTDPNFPDNLPTGFHIIFYNNDSTGGFDHPTGSGAGDPTGTGTLYTFTMAEVGEVSDGAGGYEYSVTLNPPFHANANTKYWVAAQEVLVFQPQWGWQAHNTAPVPLSPLVQGFPLLGTNYWAQVAGEAANFCLTVLNTITGACCWDEGQTPPTTPYCEDGYLDFFCTQQGGRFSAFHQCNAGGPLPQIDPPCGQANGACCKPDGTCTLVKASQCPPATGLFLGYLTTCDQCPCLFIPNCPPGGIAETEACGSHTNDGCGATPQAFSDIHCGDTVCGTVYADAGQAPTRDPDWWRLVLTTPQTVTFTLKSEFPMFMGFAVFNPDGSPDCANYGGYVGPYQATTDNTENCNGLSVSKTCAAGTYYIIVQPYVTDGYPCTPGTYNNYIGTLTCVNAPEDCDANALYANQTGSLFNVDAGHASSQIGSNIESQVADDFILPGPGTQVGQVRWVGGYWNPGVGTPTSFNIYFYNDDGSGTMPTRDPNDPTGSDPAVTAIGSYNVSLANANELAIGLGHGGGSATYKANLTPPMSLTAGTKYWMGIQCVMEFPPQWGWSYHNAIIGAPAVQGFPSLALPYWTAIAGDANFCLYGPQTVPHPCALNGDVNNDGAVNNFDINPFVYALTHTQTQFQTQYPTGNYWCADSNCDLAVNNFDINGFVACLTSGCTNCPPH